MQTPFPHHYEIQLRRDTSGKGTLISKGKPEISVGPPPQFGGTGLEWSPEELLLGALTTCIMSTFLALVSRNPIEIFEYVSHTEGILNKTASGILFERIVLHVNLKVKNSDIEKATQLINAAKKHCIIANSLSVRIEFNPVVAGVEQVKYSEAV